MKLRVASVEDIDQMVQKGMAIHNESRFVRFDYDEKKLTALLEELIKLSEAGSHLCLLMQNTEGVLVGCLIGVIEEYFFTNDKSANSILIWVEPSYRGSGAAIKMLDAFKQWAMKKNAKEINLSVSSGIRMATTDRFFRKCGFVQTGGNYSMKLD